MERNVWTKSSRSGNNGQCVEVCDRGDMVAMRDSKNPTGPELTVSPAMWSAFIAAVQGGEFDR